MPKVPVLARNFSLASCVLVAMNSALISIVLLATIAAGGGGQPYEALDAGDVFVATITRVDDKGATNAKPPLVWLEVHEVLRGDARIARSPAVWSPAFHGIDYGDENNPDLKRWEVQPLKGPKVGAKFILGGSSFKPADKNAPAYGLFAFVRIPYTDKARQQSIDALQALAEGRRKYAAEQAAALKERQDRAAAWRAAMDDKAIDKRTQQADAVAIGKIVSGSTIEIESMLKGRPRMASSGTYYVSLPNDGFDKRIADIVFDTRPRCVIFLNEDNLVASVTSVYADLVDPYEGLVLADEAAIAAVKASLEKHPPAEPRPVLVISALDHADALPLAKAARELFAVVRSQQFSAHSDKASERIRNTIPHAEYFVMMDRGPSRHVRAVRIHKDDAPTIYEATWTELETGEKIKALLKTLK